MLLFLKKVGACLIRDAGGERGTPRMSLRTEKSVRKAMEEEHGQRVSTATMSRAIRDVGWTRKRVNFLVSVKDKSTNAALQIGKTSNEGSVVKEIGRAHV